jgi:hypothetical protein
MALVHVNSTQNRASDSERRHKPFISFGLLHPGDPEELKEALVAFPLWRAEMEGRSIRREGEFANG